MIFGINLKRVLLVVLASVALTACATQKKAGTGMIQGDVYTGSDTVEYLASGVRDRVFFATNKSVLTTASRDTLRKQAAFMRKEKDLTFTIEGHADERGTREYNLALGDRRATAARDYLVALGINQNRIQTVSFGLERPVDPRSVEEAWSKNRRGVMVVN